MEMFRLEYVRFATRFIVIENIIYLYVTSYMRLKGIDLKIHFNMLCSYVAQIFIYISLRYVTKKKNLAKKAVNSKIVHQHHLLHVDKGKTVARKVRVKAYM